MSVPAVRVDDYSLTPVRLMAKFGDTDLALATGFTYRHLADLYLITNWHNVTGRHPGTLEFLDKKHAAIPDRIRLDLHTKGQLGRWRHATLPLYRDSEMQQPTWLMHPTYGRAVDVVAFRINLDDQSESFPINSLGSEDDLGERIGEDVFVLGFPKGLTGGGLLPIWKRASIATEPELDRESLPSFLIDTATREGMSGSPVILRANSGVYRTRAGNTVVQASGAGVSAPTKFLGVYSARLTGKSEFEAQLGIVWKARVITEIISGGRPGLLSDLEQ